MDPRLQAGLEIQLDKQAQQEHDASLSGVLGQHFKKEAEASPEGKQASVSSGQVMSTMLRGIAHN